MVVLVEPHALTAQRPALESAKTEALETGFAGKVVFVQTAKDTATLERGSLVQLGGRGFLVGRVVRDSGLTPARFVGTTTYLPVADILRIIVADDLDQLRNSVQAR